MSTSLIYFLENHVNTNFNLSANRPTIFLDDCYSLGSNNISGKNNKEIELYDKMRMVVPLINPLTKSLSSLRSPFSLKTIKQSFKCFWINHTFSEIVTSRDKTIETTSQREETNLAFSNFTQTTQFVTGTGSGRCFIYQDEGGKSYVMKKNKLIEFYAGMLFKLILEDRSPEIIFIQNDENSFYVGSQFESSYQDMWIYHSAHKKPLLDVEQSGLAEIVVAAFLLGDRDLKGLGSADSNIGIVGEEGKEHYFKIDHEQAFLFGGDFWRKKHQIDESWKENLEDYCKKFKLSHVIPYLGGAVQKIASIPLEKFEKTCDFCEKMIGKYPEILKATMKYEGQYLLLENSDLIIKDAIIKRVKAFKELVSKEC